jgi:hypothetical protein
MSIPVTVPSLGWASSPEHKAVKVPNMGGEAGAKAGQQLGKDPGMVGVSIGRFRLHVPSPGKHSRSAAGGPLRSSRRLLSLGGKSRRSVC